MTGLAGALVMIWLIAAVEAPASAVETPQPIQDNSFLIEEAFNQEAGVVQHIATFQRDLRASAWVLAFTQEWPVPRQRHQLSVTIAGLHVDRGGGRGRTGLGDLVFNYRYQLRAGAAAVAPRFSVSLPTGDYRHGRGAGTVGYQVNVPVSLELGHRLVTHLNAGATLVPGARNEAGMSATVWGVNVGQSFIWLLRPRLNPMVEFLYSRIDAVVDRGRARAVDGAWVNPGVRWAFDFKSGLQIVPGLSAPIGVGPSAGQRAIFFYLSFEHPMFGVR